MSLRFIPGIGDTCCLLLFVFVLASNICFAQTTSQKVYGGVFLDWANKIIETRSNNYIVAGLTQINGGDVPFIMQMDCRGNISWIKILTENFSSQGLPRVTNVIETFDGGLVGIGRGFNGECIYCLSQSRQ